MGSIQRETRPSIQREDQLTMETQLEQIAVKAANQLPKCVVREIRTPRSVGAGAGDRLRRPGGREVTRVLTAKVVPDCQDDQIDRKEHQSDVARGGRSCT
jgi:hypothetical protein